MDNHIRKNIHFLHDDKFTDGAIEQFDSYFPGQNLYIIFASDISRLRYTHPNTNCLILNLRNRKNTEKILATITQYSCKNLFIHYIDSYKAVMALSVLAKYDIKVYWIFYGGDLYGYLQKHKDYPLFDREEDQPRKPLGVNLIKSLKYLVWFGVTPDHAIQKLFLKINYFCFWNENDFYLFKDNFEVKAAFKSFIYYKALGVASEITNTERKYLLINHSASPTGNHLTLLTTLRNIDLKKIGLTPLLPLSYGDMEYAHNVSTAFQQNYGDSVEIMKEFVSIETYQYKLSQVRCAVFGMRRQEAAGNIFQLLNMGARVFLRNENNLLKWLTDRDFIIFSIENDLKSEENLNQLNDDEIAHNRACYQRYFNLSAYNHMMEHLIET